MSVSLDDDSDGEADRRQALIFKAYDTIDPEKDAMLQRPQHVRAKSLPPPVQLQVEQLAVVEETSLDRRPSHLRKHQDRPVSPDLSVRIESLPLSTYYCCLLLLLLL